MKKVIKLFSTLFISLLLIFSHTMNVNAASGTISVSSSTSKVVVGNTFNVTVKISSGTALGSWEWTISYDKNKLKLVSGESNVADTFQKEGTKSQSYTYKFKAVGTGSSKVTVKSYGAFDINEKSLSLSVGSKTISVITQAQLEASYSKNNNLKSLSVDGLKLDSNFSKDKLEYKTEADSNTEEIKINATAEDSKSSVIGSGTHKVSEGENKFNITVTAENGSTKTYVLIVNVKDPNPIKIPIGNEELIVIKRESSLQTPEGFEKTTVELENQKVPGFYNELNDFTLLGLKDNEGNIKLYLYDIKNQKYTKYVEVMMNDVKLFPLTMDKTFKQTTTSANILSVITDKFNDYDFIKSKVIIDGIEFEALKQTKNSEYYIIHARDILTGKDNYYTYDSVINTVIRYDEKQDNLNKEKINNYKTLILVLGIETIITIIILICMLIKQVSNNKKRRKLYEELERRKKEDEEKKLQEDKIIKKKNKKKKMIDKDDEKEEEDI